MSEIKGYIVCLYRRISDEPVLLAQVDSFEEAKVCWTKAHEEWTNSVAEHRPFILEEPVLTAFDPSLILEILVTPIYTTAAKSSNPYERATSRRGFSEVLTNPHGLVGELNDQGFR